MFILFLNFKCKGIVFTFTVMTKVTYRGIKKEPFTYLQYTGGAGGTLEWVTPLLSSPILLFTKKGKKGEAVT